VLNEHIFPEPGLNVVCINLILMTVRHCKHCGSWPAADLNSGK